MRSVLLLAEAAGDRAAVERVVQELRSRGVAASVVRRGPRPGDVRLDADRPLASALGVLRLLRAAPEGVGAVVVTDPALQRWGRVVGGLLRCRALSVDVTADRAARDVVVALAGGADPGSGERLRPDPVAQPAQAPGTAPRRHVRPVHVAGVPVRRLVQSEALHEPPRLLLAGDQPSTEELAAARHLAAGGVLLADLDPVSLSAQQAERAAEAGGRAAVEALRRSPELLPWLEAGAWARASTRDRALRRLLVAGVPLPVGVDRRADAAYWSGVRRAATRREWAALTRSYVVLAYHRVAGRMAPGQERLDLRPELFARQMRLLRRIGLRPLDVDDLREAARLRRPLPRRGVLVTLDDGYVDALQAAVAARAVRPHVYLPTALVGGVAGWADDAPLADWPMVRSAARAGVVVGGHGRRHRPLDGLSAAELEDEIAGSRADLLANVPEAVDVLAYPNGRHDLAALEHTARAGYALAWTTRPGRNGAGTHPLCLRRIGVKDWDTAPALGWKLVTGRPLPALWERLALARWRRTGRSAGRR